MPIYEYRCDECAGRFEVLTRFAEREQPQVCPRCESQRTRVLVSTFAAIGGEEAGDFAMPAGGGGGCACGGACSCGGH